MEKYIVVNSRFLTQSLTGVQRFAIEISKVLKNLYGNKVVFVSPNGILHQDLADELGALVIGKRKGHLWEQIDLLVYLRSVGMPLLLNLANTGPLLYKNKISSVHDVAFITYPKTFSKSFVLFYRFLIPQLIRTSRHLITVSLFSKAEIVKYYKVPESKISVIYNAVDSSFRYTRDNTLSSKKYLIAVSSLNHRKNLLSTLKAFVELSSVYNDVYLYIIGDFKSDSFREVDLATYKTHANIVFCGRVSDEELVKYYSNAIGFLFPSYYEGFGIPPLEAQACGCPVIVSNVSSLPEVFQDSALYCSPYSVSSITEALKKIVTNEELRLELIDRGNVNLKRYSWEISANKIMQIIDNVIYEKSSNT